MFKFTLNKMQEEAKALCGENITISAPTGSGKTEAALLAIPQGSRVSYLLPTITSANFMYKRLCADFPQLTVRIYTSVIDEIRTVKNAPTTITIVVGDGPMIQHLLKGEKSLEDVIVLDEYDNYPLMVRTALVDYIQQYSPQVIVPSATLEEGTFDTFRKIEYHKELSLDKHLLVCGDFNLTEVVEANEHRKIGMIFNSIAGIEKAVRTLEGKLDGLRVIVHHASLTEYERLQNEEALFNGEFDVVISNDLISYSVDIDFDVLITEMTDNLGLLIQRLGRCNRRNQKVYHINTYVLHPGACQYTEVPFVDEYEAIMLWQENISKYVTNGVLTYQAVQTLRSTLPAETLPSVEEVREHLRNQTERGVEYTLRPVPVNFVLPVQYTDKKTDEVVSTFRLIKSHGEDIPWAWSPCSDFGGDKNILHVKRQNYRLTGEKDDKGREIVEEYYGTAYEEVSDFARELAEALEIVNPERCVDYYSLGYAADLIAVREYQEENGDYEAELWQAKKFTDDYVNWSEVQYIVDAAMEDYDAAVELINDTTRLAEHNAHPLMRRIKAHFELKLWEDCTQVEKLHCRGLIFLWRHAEVAGVSADTYTLNKIEALGPITTDLVIQYLNRVQFETAFPEINHLVRKQELKYFYSYRTIFDVAYLEALAAASQALIRYGKREVLKAMFEAAASAEDFLDALSAKLTSAEHIPQHVTETFPTEELEYLIKEEKNKGGVKNATGIMSWLALLKALNETQGEVIRLRFDEMQGEYNIMYPFVGLGYLAGLQRMSLEVCGNAQTAEVIMLQHPQIGDCKDRWKAFIDFADEERLDNEWKREPGAEWNYADAHEPFVDEYLEQRQNADLASIKKIANGYKGYQYFSNGEI